MYNSISIPIVNSLPMYGQISTNKYEIKFKQCQKNNKKYVINAVNNSTGILSLTEAKNILIQLGEAAKRTALGKIDALSNLSDEIKEGIN